MEEQTHFKRRIRPAKIIAYFAQRNQGHRLEENPTGDVLPRCLQGQDYITSRELATTITSRKFKATLKRKIDELTNKLELENDRKRRRPRATEPTFENVFGHWTRFRRVSEELQQ